MLTCRFYCLSWHEPLSSRRFLDAFYLVSRIGGDDGESHCSEGSTVMQWPVRLRNAFGFHPPGEPTPWPRAFSPRSSVSASGAAPTKPEGRVRLHWGVLQPGA